MRSRPFHRVLLVQAALALLVLLNSPRSAQADAISLGTAGQFAVLGLNDGFVTINSATKIQGNVGYSDGVFSHTNQKVDTFIGTAYVHSGADFQYTAATYAPTGGIQTGPSVDVLLDLANTDATAAAAYYAALVPSTNLGAVTGNQSFTSSAPGSTNVYAVSSLDLNGNTFTLHGLGTNASFVFNVSGNFDWSQSQLVLDNVLASNVLFNFVNGTSTIGIDVNKAETVFNGTILAPSINAELVYHNPATFNGRIIARDITLHSDFNITNPGDENGPPPVPLPTAALGGFALCSMVGLRKPLARTRRFLWSSGHA